MLDEVEQLGDAEALGARRARQREADHGLRPSRLPRRGPALADPQADRARARLAADRDRGGARAGRAEGAAGARIRSACSRPTSSTTRPIVLDVAEIPPPLAPAMFACSRVAGWSAHILEQKRTGRLFRPSARYVGPANRRLDEVADLRSQLTLAEAAASADELAQRGSRARARGAARAVGGRARGSRPQRRLPRARRRLSRDRPVPVPPEARAAPAWARGREPGLPRLGAALARAALARPPGRRQRGPAAAAHARQRRRQPGRPPARDRLPEERLAAARHDRPPRGARRGRRARTRELARAAQSVAPA